MADDITLPTAPTPEVPPTPPAAQPPAPEKTFTQAELDAIVRDRLKREKEKFADYDQLKTAATKLAEIEQSQLSETEKLTRKLAELETAKTQAETRARETLIRSKVISEAARLNFNDPEDAYNFIKITEIEFADNGEPKNVAELVKVLAESRKYLIKSTNPALAIFNPAGGGNAPQETDAQKRARIYGGGGNFFDPSRATEMGGGVFWPKGKPEE